MGLQFPSVSAHLCVDEASRVCHKSIQPDMTVASRLNDFFDTVQVELRGRYSLARLHEILQHAKHTRPWSHIAIMLLTPVPVICLRVLTDALPLHPPEGGVLHQTGGLYLRVFLIVTIQAFMITVQAGQSSPTLPLSAARLWWIALTTGSVSFAAFIFLGVMVAFPTPFVIHMIAIPWVITWVTNLWAAWRDECVRDGEAKRKLIRFVTIVFSGQVGMFFVYSAYLIAFTSIQSECQVYFTMLMPVIKLAFKNWVINGTKYMEDLAPTTVAFNVDVYHAIFVSSSMQSANSIGSLLLIMAIDVIQGVVAYYEVSKMYHLAEKLASKCGIDNNVRDLGSADRRTQSLLRKLNFGVVDYALNIIESNPRICGHPDLALPQHRSGAISQHIQSAPSGATQTNQVPSRAGPMVQKIVEVTQPMQRSGAPRIVPVASLQHSDDSAPQLNMAECAQLECVKSVLKMLHMIEFYVLIEFVEVLVPFISAVSMRSLVYLPNRVYYMNLASLTADEVTTQANRVVLYTLLELLSFVVFCVLMDRRLHRTSTYQILAFVLQKHAQVAITALSMWAFLIVQLQLRHLGADSSFQFAWMRETNSTT